jgi:hypothetical protein
MREESKAEGERRDPGCSGHEEKSHEDSIGL